VTHATSSWKSGFYLGAGVGVGHLKTETFAGFLANDTKKYTISDNNILGNIFLGYDYSFADSWIFGIEGSAGLSTLDGKDNSVVDLAADIFDRTEAKERYNCAFAGRLGRTVGNGSTLVYVRVGARFSNFRFTQQTATAGALSSKLTETKTKVAFEPGIGFQTKLSQSVSLGSEYTYAWYNSSRINDPDGSHHKFKPEVGRFMVRITFHT